MHLPSLHETMELVELLDTMCEDRKFTFSIEIALWCDFFQITFRTNSTPLKPQLYNRVSANER